MASRRYRLWACSARRCRRTGSRLPVLPPALVQEPRARLDPRHRLDRRGLRGVRWAAAARLWGLPRNPGLVAAGRLLAPGRPLPLSAQTPGRLTATAARPRRLLAVPTPAPRVGSV